MKQIQQQPEPGWRPLMVIHMEESAAILYPFFSRLMYYYYLVTKLKSLLLLFSLLSSLCVYALVLGVRTFGPLELEVWRF